MLQRAAAFQRPLAFQFNKVSSIRSTPAIVNHFASNMNFGRNPQAFSTVPVPPSSNHPHVELSGATGKLIYTETDEAPALATYSLLPILSKFGGLANIDVVPCDISLSGSLFKYT